MAHTITDPMCVHYRSPRWWQQGRYDRARGYECRECADVRHGSMPDPDRPIRWPLCR